MSQLPLESIGRKGSSSSRSGSSSSSRRSGGSSRASGGGSSSGNKFRIFGNDIHEVGTGSQWFFWGEQESRGSSKGSKSQNMAMTYTG